MNIMGKRIQTLILFFAILLTLAPQAHAAQSVRFSAETVTAKAGDTVRVRILMNDSPGIINLRLRVSYDTEKLTLTQAETADLPGVTFGPVSNTPFIISWTDAIHDALTGNAAVAVLVFQVTGGASGEAAVTLSSEADDIFNSDFENVPYTLTGGGVRITSAQSSTEIVSVTKTSSGTTAVLSNVTDGLKIICSAYDANGKMTGVEIRSSAAGNNTYSFSFTGAGSVRVFVVDTAFRPVCGSKSG